ncbi:hypothetical protein TPHA_0A03830 [Tetrapisispora phaffii CBS 4417]|uniref:TEA domain-containing protein n=1 Tax=Tetrapisispora phaffii (strain ATCC 24235 / CBS 4417 / NBRC 1672 / NRRL Y-8282 / UCD 70-5) TaxID=1071381 RepID=G8BNI1_TETPH|nr:hypothetical protein TPHA_0A03830 [Tetrapisispora phaffii CBS 4417]CCE61459.1 hypothetical protein TPHA_0A03830 [Tetrapisispora phaffii CBS 4417]
MTELEDISKIKVFDVYTNIDGVVQSSLHDVFRYKDTVNQETLLTTSTSVNTYTKTDGLDDRNEEIESDSSLKTIELLNTGIGEKSDKLNKEFFNNLKNTKHNVNNNRLQLSQPNSCSIDRFNRTTDVYLTPDTTVKTSSNSSVSNLASLYGNDKWTSNIENAFVDSLRIIMKNGTYKIKIFDKNYGRNELISMYIKHKTGEVRTKKQISSHIQVLKKAFKSKIEGKLKLDRLETEMHNLIENGAEPTEKTIHTFFTVFENIIKDIEKERGDHFGKHNLNNSNLITPLTSKLDDSSFLSNDKVGLISDDSKMYSPSTALSHAKMIYKNLKDYTCVLSVNYSKVFIDDSPKEEEHQDKSAQPNDMRNDSSTLSKTGSIKKPAHMKTNGKDSISRSSLIKLAKKVKLQQRQLIEDKMTVNESLPGTCARQAFAKITTTYSNGQLQTKMNPAASSSGSSGNSNYNISIIQNQPQPYLVQYPSFLSSASSLPLMPQPNIVYPHQQQQLPFLLQGMVSPTYSNFRMLQPAPTSQQFYNSNHGIRQMVESYKISSPPPQTVLRSHRFQGPDSNANAN